MPDDGQRHASCKGVEFLVREEGVKEKYYEDSHGNCTKTVGVLVHTGACTRDETTIRLSDAEISADFSRKLLENERSLRDVVGERALSRLNAQQFDALTSFIFNAGAGDPSLPPFARGQTGFRSSDVLRDVLGGRLSSIPSDLLHFENPRRRTREGRLFATGEYGSGP